MPVFLTTASELQSVAQTIRSRAMISDQLSYPQGFIDGINSINRHFQRIENIVPMESEQIIIASTGYNGIQMTHIASISSSYLGTSVIKLSESTYMPGNTSYIISSMRLLEGPQIVYGDSNLVPENIIFGRSIFGVNGELSQSCDVIGELRSPYYLITDAYPGSELTLSYATRIIAGSTKFQNLIKISGDKVIDICDYAFTSCSLLQNVDCPNCETIGNYAFQGCTSLLSAYFPACKTIGGSAFNGCTGLTTINIEACEMIGSWAFCSCSFIMSAIAPLCKSIGRSAFYACKSLSIASFPLCEELGSGVFYECLALIEIDMPLCKKIGSNAFIRCQQLSSVNFPVCETIFNSAFKQCSELTSISLSICSSIYADAFISCQKLESIYLLSTSMVSLANMAVFNYTPMSLSDYLGHYGSIYVPSSLLTEYKSTGAWSYYSSRFVGI